MPHRPEPFFKASRSTWYVEIDRRQINLGHHPEGYPPPRKGKSGWNAPEPILQKFHELMAKKPEQLADNSLVAICKKYLDWVQDNRDPETYVWYERHLDHFVNDIPRGLLVSQLRPKHVTESMSKHPSWGDTNKNGYCRAAQRCFKWAEEEGELDASPLRKVKKPRAKRRNLVIEADDFHRMLQLTRDQQFRDLLTVIYEVGCRAEEILAVEARHFDPVLEAWIFPFEDVKGERTYRNGLPDADCTGDYATACQAVAGRSDLPEHRWLAVECILCELPVHAVQKEAWDQVLSDEFPA